MVSHETAAVDSTANVSANIEVRTYSTEDCRAAFPWWDDLDDEEKLEALDTGRVVPEQVVTDRNTTCIGLHELLVDILDDSQVNPDDWAMDLAVGNDDTTVPASSDTSLNNKVDQTSVTEYADESDQLRTRTFLSTNVANGYELKEVGLIADSRLLNHSLLTTHINKDSSTEATVTAILSFAAA